jgi:hypothetical protein
MNIGYYTSAKLCGKLYDNVYMLKIYKLHVQDNQQEYNNIKYYTLREILNRNNHIVTNINILIQRTLQ